MNGAALASPKLPQIPHQPASLQPLPINLPTALQLASAAPLDIALATERIQAAAAQNDRASTLWLPTIYLGVNYARHDGQLQDIIGNVFTTSRSTFMAGAGPSAVFAITDAVFSPLAARQVLKAKEADRQATINDVTFEVAAAYFNVQQARGELAGALDSVRRADELVHRVEGLSAGLTPRVEIQRAMAERARRRQAVTLAHEHWETASAELGRILRLPPTSLVIPEEEPHLRLTIIDEQKPLDDLIAMGLGCRPELASRRALVEATLARLKQEKIRPLVPSVLLRGNATNPSGALSSGVFGGGRNDDLTNFNGRNSLDLQVLWELQNMGFGNRASVRERKAESQQALLEVFRMQDRVASEIVQAHSQARRAAERIADAEDEVNNAYELAEKSLEGLRQTRRQGDLLVLLFRPQEVVAALLALDRAYSGYFLAVADSNRAQFRLYRAMGCPAQALLTLVSTPADESPSIVGPAIRDASATGQQ